MKMRRGCHGGPDKTAGGGGGVSDKGEEVKGEGLRKTDKYKLFLGRNWTNLKMEPIYRSLCSHKNLPIYSASFVRHAANEYPISTTCSS